MIGRTGRATLALAVAASAFSALLPSGTASAAEAAAGRQVAVALDEWRLLPGQITARAGRVTFVVRNDGAMDHEFLVLRSDRHHHSLAVKNGRAVETGRLGKIPLIRKGTTRKITLKVPRGKYVLLCNMLGHYQAGQYASLRVR